ncbi:MAG: energy-dependent translational throttle protein EttA [Planctomycetes bacterium]|nr:energy-dependent translational throttle protein EttA [Planctomycetota bacterium]
MPPISFSINDIHKEYGDRVILDGISLSFYLGAKIGIVGPNGSGKSTLLKIMAGVDKDFHGEVTLKDGVSILLVEQEPRLDFSKNVRGNIEEAVAPLRAMLERYEKIGEEMGEHPEKMDELMAEMDELQTKLDAANAWELDHTLDLAADALVLPPDDADVKTLSGGERRRVALCRALLMKPDILLLDEPTNHLDAETIRWLEDQLREYPGTVIVVTHDRYFLDNITKWILEIENGKGLPFEGNYSSWLAQKAERLRLLEKRETDRQRILQRELQWINTAARGRNQKNAARIARYENLAAQEFQVNSSDCVIQIPPGPKLGNQVVEFHHVSKGFRGVTLIDDLSFEVPHGAIVGIVGPNGMGKTTLFRMLVGQEKPDSGEIVVGKSVQMAYVDQNRDELVAEHTIYEEISGGNDELLLGGKRMNSRAYVARFNFRGTEQQKLVGNLSGGERNRVHLAKLLRTGGNLLLLDEPTNDLDVNTLRVLEEALEDFPACAMVISHDRFFLDRICTHLMVFTGNGQVKWFNGNFADYEASLGDRGEPAGRRNRYKRLPLV